MNSHDVPKESPAWMFQVWAAFVLSSFMTGVGIFYLPVDPWIRGFLAMGLVFVVGSSFSLAKTLRDIHEAKRLLNRLNEAKAEKIIREFETEAARPYAPKAA